MASEAIVIGSGAAGVAAASALAERGVAVRIIDAGRAAPAEVRARVEPLAATEPEEWSAGATDELRGATLAAMRRQAADTGEARGVDTVNRTVKPIFGSLFPYAIDSAELPTRSEGPVSLHPSLARGGLTNAWGAAMLPLGPRDLHDWPMAAADLEQHYRAVLRYVPLAADRDALEEIAPLYTEKPGTLSPTPQIARFVADLAKARGRLRSSGAWAGRARLAVWTGERAGARRCRLVGLCLHGCPYGAIWSASQALEALVDSGRVRYEPGLIAQHVEERDGAVRIRVAPAGGGAHEERIAERVFVACGVLESTRLVLASLGAFDRPVRVRDSQVFAVPFVRAPGSRVSVSESGNTLAQAFLELQPQGEAEEPVHVQFYGFNDLMLAEAAATLRVSPARAERTLGPLLGRLLYAQVYVHSRESSSVVVRLGADGTLNLAAEPNPRTSAARKDALRRLVGLSPALKALPVLPMVSTGLIGTGNHAGGSLPMSNAPGDLETDVVGRPAGFERLHVVDASVFPTTPAPTITLAAMANATRIAATVAGS